MPAIKLDSQREHGGQFFAVVGTYSTSTGAFVAHSALLHNECRIRYGDAVRVTHMCPPLKTNDQEAHLIGWVETIEPEVVRKIQMWIDDMRTRMPASVGLTQTKVDQYSLKPAVDEIRDPVNGRLKYMRFSCAGFVVKCYEDNLRVRLLDWERDDFPEITWEEIDQHYPITLTRLLRRYRHAIGLTGNGPWSLMLPGYVFKALSRPTADIKERAYSPKSFQDAFF